MRSFRVALVVCAASSLIPLAHAQTHTCLSDRQETTLGENSVALQDYVCKIDPDAKEGLRVRFVRLGEAAAGSLLKGPPVAITDLLANAKFLKEDRVYKETVSLFKRFGVERDYDGDISSWGMSFENQYTNKTDRQNNIQLFEGYILHTFYFSTRDSSSAVVLESTKTAMLNSNNWPQNYSMYYTCPTEDFDTAESPQEHSDFISCTTVWKYMGRDGLDPIFRDIKEEYHRAEREYREQTGKRIASELDQNLKLFRFLAQQGWTERLSVVGETYGPIDCDVSVLSWQVSYSVPQFVLDLVVITNGTDKPIRIGGFFGSQGSVESVRPVWATDQLAAQAPTRLNLPPVSLPPHQSVAIGLRISFASAQPPIYPNWSRSGKVDEHTIDKIYSWPADHVFEIDGIRKVRDSFLPPKRPDDAEHAYGPETLMLGLEADGRRFTFEGRRPNILLSRFIPNRCCPILYSRTDVDGPWLYHGRVLREANGPEHAKVDNIEFPSLRTRFRISEEEPEVSVIDHVRLNLFLRDGRKIDLSPQRPGPRVIVANTASDVVFDLPPGVLPADVRRSVLEITGYYRRYGGILTTSAGAGPLTRRGK